MEENSQKAKTVLKYLLIFLALILVGIVYTIIDARIHQKRDTTSPEAYGVDSLDAIIQPPIEIEIWQKNDKVSEKSNPADHFGIYEPQAKYYTRIPLKLEVGASVCTTYDTLLMPSPSEYSLIASVFYDEGTVRCTYDLPVKNIVTMKASSDLVPDMYSGDIQTDNSDVVQSPNGCITGNRSFSFSISDAVRNRLISRHDAAFKTPYAEIYLSQIESEAHVDLNDYYYLEKLKDVYPDAPNEIQDCERIVLTTHLTVEAMHPTKQDVVIASAVLEIKSYSWWLNTDSKPQSLFTDAGIISKEYSVVTVISYEQSDMLLMDLYS